MDYNIQNQECGQSYVQDNSIHVPSAFSTDDEALRLLKQLTDEQNELLQQIHPSNKKVAQHRQRPNEQYLTIALDGKFV